jgi:uncharacterized membrane protein (DUF485 family)
MEQTTKEIDNAYKRILFCVVITVLLFLISVYVASTKSKFDKLESQVKELSIALDTHIIEQQAENIGK